MTKMLIAPGNRPRVKLKCLRMLATLKLDKARAILIGAFMTNYLKLTSGETAVYNKMLKTVEPKVREVVMQLTNEWIEEGVQKGLLRGLQEGRQEGRRDLILRQLRRRVDAIPAKLARQIDRLDDAAMISLGDALLDFTSPADAQRWLAQRNKEQMPSGSSRSRATRAKSTASD
jgi:predicted transposase YdaD